LLKLMPRNKRGNQKPPHLRDAELTLTQLSGLESVKDAQELARQAEYINCGKRTWAQVLPFLIPDEAQ
jgi:hypothetical protein